MAAILTIQEMADLEEKAFANGVDAWELMQEAGQKMAEAIQRRFCSIVRCRVYVGKGNNGGDALVVARLLGEAGWNVEVRCPFSIKEMSPLAQRARSEWGEVIQKFEEPQVVIDGLLGIGAKGSLKSPIAEMILEINEARKKGATVFALDLPSGLGNATAVVADHTLTVGFPKDVLLTDEATHFVGRISVLPLEKLTFSQANRNQVSTALDLRHLLPPRTFDRHKGQCGRIALVAGSLGTAGAAVLAANGALRAGAGLVSLFCPPEIYSFLAPMLPPEIMARPWENPADLADENFDVIAIGPGLSPGYAEVILPLIRSARVPLVLDAGALTMVTPGLLDELEVSVLLTPHPGEMDRLFPANSRSRAQWAGGFSQAHQATLLLKGARTVVAEKGKPLSFNSTGQPGMATGGMGDTLTGVCAALMGQKLSAYDAARLGAWICGRAAEIAIEQHSESQESLLPSTLADCLGAAFQDLRRGVY